AKIVHIEGYSLVFPNLAQRTIKYAKAAGATVSLDLASFEIIHARKTEFLDLIKSGVDICFGNEGEIKALTELTAREGCEYLKEICPIVVATMGKNGCWVGHKDDIIFSPSICIENPLDTTGAGDLFISGYLHGYLKGHPLNLCAHYGALAGSAVVQVEGARLNESQWQSLRKQMLKV
ncbi:MAG: adenosine kinase, partial [Parachlamydiaceae bacterium]|nr:adenosine kinase [Parachlamydiaceae bacterium]